MLFKTYSLYSMLSRVIFGYPCAFCRWDKQYRTESPEFNHPNNGIPSVTFLSLLIYLLSQNLVTMCQLHGLCKKKTKRNPPFTYLTFMTTRKYIQ